MDWENDPGVTEEAVKAVKEARDRADAFHEVGPPPAPRSPAKRFMTRHCAHL